MIMWRRRFPLRGCRRFCAGTNGLALRSKYGRELSAVLVLVSRRRCRLGRHAAPNDLSIRTMLIRKPLLTGVRTVALFEAAKGALVLAAGLGLLGLIHRDVQAFAERLVRASHL